MNKRLWIGSFFLLALSALTLWWVRLVGLESGGQLMAVTIIAAGAPVAVTWICFFCLRLTNVAQTWHLANVVALSVTSYFLFRFPTHFYLQASQLQGKTMWEVRRQLKGYSETVSEPVVPGTYVNSPGATHLLVFTADDWHSATASIYFQNGRVVSAEINPD